MKPLHPLLQELAGAPNTPEHECMERLEPVVSSLIERKMPAEAIIATLVKLTVLTADRQQKH